MKNFVLHFFLIFLVFRDRVSLCSFGAYPGTHSGNQAGLRVDRDPSASASGMLGLKACANNARPTLCSYISFEKTLNLRSSCLRFPSDGIKVYIMNPCYCSSYISFLKKIQGQGWRDSSEVKSIDSSSRGPEFNSQQKHGVSQPYSMRSGTLF